MAAQAGEEKASAITSYPAIAPVWEHAISASIGSPITAHKDAVTFAIQHPTLSGSWQGSTIGGYTVGQDALDARGYLDTLGNQQFRSGMQDVKNVRTQTEAMKIGGSMTNLDRPTNSQKVIDDELKRLKDNAYRGYATITAAAGKQVPYKYKGMADSTYLSKTLPSERQIHTTTGRRRRMRQPIAGAVGAEEEPANQCRATMSAGEDVDEQTPGQRGPLIQHLREQGIDPSGL